MVFTTAPSSVAQYLKNDLQQILKTVLDFRPFVPLLAPAPACQQYKSLYKRLLKAEFLDVYWDTTHLKCYNFFQQCEDYFAIASAKSQNQVLFATTFFKNTGLFCWQQYQRKIKDKTNVFISWQEFKAFFYQSLGKSKAFVNTI